jgi:dihydroorotase
MHFPFSGSLSWESHRMHSVKPAFAAVIVLVFTFVIHTTAQNQSARYDLLLKGGHVIDPANHIDGVMDVAVSKNKIAAVQKDIPATDAGKVVDVTGL